MGRDERHHSSRMLLYSPIVAILTSEESQNRKKRGRQAAEEHVSVTEMMLRWVEHLVCLFQACQQLSSSTLMLSPQQCLAANAGMGMT
jgi:hypothetical protein